MMTLAKLKSKKGSKPYPTPLKVKVCGVGTTSQYTTDKGEAKESTVVGLADKTEAAKAIVYDKRNLSVCRVGSTVMILHYIYKSDPCPTIVITNKTKVMMTSSLEVEELFQKEAERIANPPPPECLPIKLAKTSPVKSLISVKGKVVSEDIVKTVCVRGSEVNVKTVKIQDEDDDMKVSLWRELSNKSLMGQYIQITNVVVSSYKDEVSLSTTTKTQIETSQEPSSETKGELVGFESGDVIYEVMVQKGDDFKTFDIQKDLICSAFDSTSEELDSILQERIPFSCKLIVTEGNVVFFELL